MVAAARGWVGVPWRHQGRTRAGIDCVGLLIVVAQDLGIDDGFDFRAYSRRPDGRALRELMVDKLDRAAAIAPGRIGLFAQAGTYPCHVGVFGDRTMIHAHALNRKVVEHRLSDEWRCRLRGVFRYPAMAA